MFICMNKRYKSLMVMLISFFYKKVLNRLFLIFLLWKVFSMYILKMKWLINWMSVIEIVDICIFFLKCIRIYIKIEIKGYSWVLFSLEVKLLCCFFKYSICIYFEC